MAFYDITGAQQFIVFFFFLMSPLWCKFCTFKMMENSSCLSTSCSKLILNQRYINENWKGRGNRNIKTPAQQCSHNKIITPRSAAYRHLLSSLPQPWDVRLLINWNTARALHLYQRIFADSAILNDTADGLPPHILQGAAHSKSQVTVMVDK